MEKASRQRSPLIFQSALPELAPFLLRCAERFRIEANISFGGCRGFI